MIQWIGLRIVGVKWYNSMSMKCFLKGVKAVDSGPSHERMTTGNNRLYPGFGFV
jgi:hypothetical protein